MDDYLYENIWNQFFVEKLEIIVLIKSYIYIFM